MKTPLRIAFAGLALAALLAGSRERAPAGEAGQGGPAAPRQVKQYTIDQFLANTAYGGASFSPDGRKILVGSNQTGVFNAFAIPVDGGKPVQLTDSKVSAIQPIGYFPHDERFLYTSDQGGNEKNHLYVQSPDGKVQRPHPGRQAQGRVPWAGRRTRRPSSSAPTSATRAPSTSTRWRSTATSASSSTRTRGATSPAGISPDRRYVALAKVVTNAASDIYLYDRTTGQAHPDRATRPKATRWPTPPQDFSPDGKSLYYTTDQGREFAYLVRYDLATGKRTEVLRPDWDVIRRRLLARRPLVHRRRSTTTPRPSCGSSRRRG